jgi:hypothetical protein
MKAKAILRDPVFQLNILLWMAKEQPADHFRVRPLFHELGFSVMYIEQPFPFPDDSVRAMDASGMEISRQPEPELMLRRMKDNKALYFEAKAGSFGPNSSNRKQALGHLLATGPAFNDVYAPLTCLLCYVLPADERALMADCLASLSAELSGKSLEPGRHSVHGLSVEGADLAYVWDQAFCEHVGSADVGCAEQRAVLMHQLEDDTDPAPLLLVFSDEDCPNCETRDFYRRALVEQVRASLLCDLHSLDLGTRFSMTADHLLEKTTEGLFDYLGKQRQKRLRCFIRENVIHYLFDQWKDKQPENVSLTGGELTIKWNAAAQQGEFLEWLEDRRRAFPVASVLEEPPLFRNLVDDDEAENQ